jgi:hypothetical protein
MDTDLGRCAGQGKAAGTVPGTAGETGQPSGLVGTLHHGLASQSHLLNWADKTFGQGLTSLTKGAPLSYL